MSDYEIFWSISGPDVSILDCRRYSYCYNIQHTNYKMGRVLEFWNKMHFVVSVWVEVVVGYM